ncbi:MAG: DUF4440 domain-containing protein [Streptosporangiales bacterium]|nr:DUF4440 domain-containing protein [Streptosporangiales bacterium]
MNENIDGPAPGTDDAVHAELVGVGDAFAAAVVSNDTARIAGFMADDWVMVSWSGMTTRDQFLSVIESGDLTHSAMDRVSAPRIRVYGDTAVISVRVTNTAHYLGRRVDADEWTTDVFARQDDRWRCVLTHITPVSPAP